MNIVVKALLGGELTWFYSLSFVSGLYLRRTCSVPTPYFLRVEVPLSGECTEQVRLWYGSGMEQTPKKDRADRITPACPLSL